mgnify:CR=1 FL=1
MSGVQSLSEKYMISILLHVQKNPGCMKTELYRATSNNPNRLDKLESLGLLVQTRTVYNGATVIVLTEKGMEVAKLLERIDRAILRSAGCDPSKEESPPNGQKRRRK